MVLLKLVALFIFPMVTTVNNSSREASVKSPPYRKFICSHTKLFLAHSQMCTFSIAFDLSPCRPKNQYILGNAWATAMQLISKYVGSRTCVSSGGAPTLTSLCEHFHTYMKCVTMGFAVSVPLNIIITLTRGMGELTYRLSQTRHCCVWDVVDRCFS